MNSWTEWTVAFFFRWLTSMTLPFTFLYVYSLLRERERRYRRGEMEEAESRMCLSFQDTDHMSPPTAPRWPLFLRGISLCTCVCRGWHWLIGRKAKSFPPLCWHVVGFFPSHNTAVLTTRPYFLNFFLKSRHIQNHTRGDVRTLWPISNQSTTTHWDTHSAHMKHQGRMLFRSGRNG